MGRAGLVTFDIARDHADAKAKIGPIQDAVHGTRGLSPHPAFVQPRTAVAAPPEAATHPHPRLAVPAGKPGTGATGHGPCGQSH